MSLSQTQLHKLTFASTGRLRNLACPCGSGKRFKHCCLAEVEGNRARLRNLKKQTQEKDDACVQKSDEQ